MDNFIIFTASRVVVGAVFSQIGKDNFEHSIFIAHLPPTAKQRALECLAVVYYIEVFKFYNCMKVPVLYRSRQVKPKKKTADSESKHLPAYGPLRFTQQTAPVLYASNKQLALNSFQRYGFAPSKQKSEAFFSGLFA